MARARIAVFPSLQDTNKFTDFDGDRTNEMVQVGEFAQKLVAVAARYAFAGAEWKVFGGTPYSQDDYHLQGLTEQQKRGKVWLDQVYGQIPTFALNLHTDSGTFSHVGCYWDGDSPGSKEMALAIRAAIAPVFQTTRLLGSDYGAEGYLFAKLQYNRHQAVLVEMGSHQNAHDEEVIVHEADLLAVAMVESTYTRLGLPIEAPQPTSPVLERTGDGLKKYYLEHQGVLGTPVDQWFDKAGEVLVTGRTAAHPTGQFHIWRNYLASIGKDPVATVCWCHKVAI